MTIQFYIYGIVLLMVVVYLLCVKIKEYKKKENEKLDILKTILNTWHEPGGVEHSIALNRVRVFFDNKKDVVSAYLDYVNLLEELENEEIINMASEVIFFEKLRKLIWAIFKHVRYEKENLDALLDFDIKYSTFNIQSLRKSNKLAYIFPPFTNNLNKHHQ